MAIMLRRDRARAQWPTPPTLGGCRPTIAIAPATQASERRLVVKLVGGAWHHHRAIPGDAAGRRFGSAGHRPGRRILGVVGVAESQRTRPPDRSVGIGGAGPSGEGLGEMVRATQGLQIARAGRAASVEGDPMVEIAPTGRHSTTREPAGPISLDDHLGGRGGRTIGTSTKIRCGTAPLAAGTARVVARRRLGRATIDRTGRAGAGLFARPTPYRPSHRRQSPPSGPWSPTAPVPWRDPG